MGTFNFGNDKYLTCKMGYMVPIQMHEVLPGDTWKMRSKAMIRMAPMVAPVLSKVKVRIHHWFVPHRLVWPNFTDFITGGEDGLNASVFPYVTVSESLGQSTLADYLGIPPAVASGTTISALPFRSYQLIKKLFYRDQDLEAAPVISTADGPDSTTDRSLQPFCWDKDIFTTARPFLQKGPDVTIPISGGPAPVELADDLDLSPLTRLASDHTLATSINPLRSDGDGKFADASNNPLALDPNGTLEVSDLDDLYIQLPDLRVGAALQRYEENRARFGGSYPDYLNFLGVRYSDQRLQRPEYLGGDQGVISFSEVLQTTPVDDEGVGNMYGHGITAFGKQGIKYRAEEHGFIISIMMVAPDSQYGNGIHKAWLRRTKEDFWQRELEHIGQEGIQNRELFAAAAMDYDPAGNFGYADRYQSYRESSGYQSVAGEMRDSLAFWHMVRLADPLAPLPFALNDSFVQCQPTNRIYQATWEDQLWCKIDNRAKVKRLVTSNARPVLF